VHKKWLVPLVLSLVVGIAGWAPAGEAADARAIIDKAIKAMGGEEKLAQSGGLTGTAKGTFSGLGLTVNCSVEGASQLPRQKRMQLKFQYLLMNITYIQVLDGDRGWLQVRGNTEEMDKEQLAAAKEDAYADWVSSILPLARDRSFTLTTLQEININDRPAVGVKVSSKGHIDVELYFDKESGLLVKSKTTGQDLRSKKAFEQESFFSGYKKVDGVQKATKRLVKRDGKEFMNIEFTEVKLHDKLPDKEFARPGD
jgi:hypothetical protein